MSEPVEPKNNRFKHRRRGASPTLRPKTTSNPTKESKPEFRKESTRTTAAGLRDAETRNRPAARVVEAPRRTEDNRSPDQPVRRPEKQRAHDRVAPEPRLPVLRNQRDHRTQHNRHRPRHRKRSRIEHDTPTTERSQNPAVIPRSAREATECQLLLPHRVAGNPTATLQVAEPVRTSSKRHIERLHHHGTDAQSNQPTPDGRRTVQSTPNQTAKSTSRTREPHGPNTDRHRRGANAGQDAERHVTH